MTVSAGPGQCALKACFAKLGTFGPAPSSGGPGNPAESTAGADAATIIDRSRPPLRPVDVPGHVPHSAGATQIQETGFCEPGVLLPHPDDAPPWWRGSMAQVDAMHAGRAFAAVDAGRAVVRTPHAVYARGSGVEELVRESLKKTFGVGEVRVREGGRLVTRPTGAVRRLSGTVIAAPPGLTARVAGVVGENLRNPDPEFVVRAGSRHFLERWAGSEEEFRGSGSDLDRARADLIGRLRVFGGGVVVATGDGPADRARAVAGACELARRGCAAVYAGSDAAAAELANTLRGLPEETRRVYHDPEADRWSKRDGAAPSGERQVGFGAFDVVVTASALSPGAPREPEVAVFADADHAWGRPPADDSLDPRDESSPAGVPCEYGGVVLPHLRGIGTRIVGLVVPGDVPGEVRLLREATFGPTVGLAVVEDSDARTPA